jgi:23S rRNA (uracil1939-C5)-methyltransferase
MEKIVQTEKVVIDKVVAGGLGLGRLADGMVVMAPYVLPGEEVLVRAKRLKKKYMEAELLEVLRASPHRLAPDCRHFGVCGGCDLQHAAYDYQLELKGKILRQHLLGARVISEAELAKVTDEPLRAPHAFGYRQRLRLQVDNQGGYGFFQNRSHVVERIESCPLAMPEINRVLEEFGNSEAMTHLLGKAREVEVLASPGDNSLVLIIALRRKPRPTDVRFAGQAADELAAVKAVYLAADGVRIQGPYCGGPLTAEDEDRSLLLQLPVPAMPKHGIASHTLCQEAGGFSQVNLEQNSRLIETMLDWVAELPVRRGLDLFGGMGNFAIPLATKLTEVVGLDLQRAAIRSAESNAEKAGISNCSFLRKAAVDGLKEFGAAGEIFDLVLLDPPRRGCRELVPFLAEVGSPTVIYVSCDPATLARDIQAMTESGYRIGRVVLIDMFPQTHHLETMVLLRK